MMEITEVELPGSGSLPEGADASSGQQPRSPSERYMASLWLEIIGLEAVSLPEKFSEVGGNSLTLNVILNRIETEKGVAFEAGLFFEPQRSSLFELARELDRLLEESPEPTRETTAPSDGRGGGSCAREA